LPNNINAHSCYFSNYRSHFGSTGYSLAYITYEGSPSIDQSLLGRDYVHHADPNDKYNGKSSGL
jgi:hypothetical protein